MSLHSQQSSHLLVICHDEQDFSNISQVLKNYFPHQDKQATLLISNKYYRANVHLQWKPWTDVLKFQTLPDNTEENQSNEEEMQQKIHKITQSPQSDVKYDLMIMLVNQNQQNIINFQTLDTIIQNFNPDQFVLLINTTSPQQAWKHQETILQKCNNFIEIVKEDLWKINKTRPVWSRGALLNNQEEANESGIFSILDRMETTRWTGMTSAKKDEPQKKVEKKVEEPITQSKEQTITKETQTQQQFSNEPKQSQSTQPTNQPQQITKPTQHPDSSDGQQMDQNKLESQMLEFQNMMGQMMSFKMQSTTMKEDQRKQKAQQLFAQMFKGMMNDH